MGTRLDRAARAVTGAARAYAVPFQQVWRAALTLAGTAPGWRVVSADPRTGEIRAEREGWLLRRRAVARIALWLDESGMTRVDVRFLTRRGTLRSPGRGSRRFLRALERTLTLTAAT